VHTREDKGGCGSDEAEEGRDFISIKHRGGRHGARSLDLGVNGKEMNRNRCKNVTDREERRVKEAKEGQI